jgi:hypothetical protein
MSIFFAAVLLVLSLAMALVVRRVFSNDVRNWLLERRRRRWQEKVKRSPPRTRWTSNIKKGQATSGSSNPLRYYENERGNVVVGQFCLNGGNVGNLVVPPNSHVVWADGAPIVLTDEDFKRQYRESSPAVLVASNLWSQSHSEVTLLRPHIRAKQEVSFSNSVASSQPAKK